MFVAGRPPDAAVIFVGANDVTKKHSIGRSAERLGDAVGRLWPKRCRRCGRHVPGPWNRHRHPPAAPHGSCVNGACYLRVPNPRRQQQQAGIRSPWPTCSHPSSSQQPDRMFSSDGPSPPPATNWPRSLLARPASESASSGGPLPTLPTLSEAAESRRLISRADGVGEPSPAAPRGQRRFGFETCAREFKRRARTQIGAHMPEAVIVSIARSPIGRAGKVTRGHARRRPDRADGEGRTASVPALDPTEIDDLILGCGPGGEQGYNLGRVVAVQLGLRPPPRNHDHPLLFVVAADHPHGDARNQGRRGRCLHFRRRRDRVELRQGKQRRPAQHQEPVRRR